MISSQSRILTTHAGSLPRPAALTNLHVAKSRGDAVDEDELADATESAISEVIAQQIDVGLDVVNNGEMGRESFFTYVRHRMSGFGGESSRPTMADLVEYPTFLARLAREREAMTRVTLMQAPKCIGAIEYATDAPIRDECAQLDRLLRPRQGEFVEAFVSAPSPGIIAAAMQNDHYESLELYVDALANALRTEYRTITDHGFVLQIDAPDLALERHTLFHGRPLEEFRAFVRTVIAAINRALEGIDPERVRLHVCWGNYEGPHDLDVPLPDIWDVVRTASVGGFLLSMANPRHAHEWRVLTDGGLPDGALVVPGVIDTTSNYVEHPETVADRIVTVVEAIGDPTRVLAGTDCGFETSAGFQTVAPEVAWVKFRSLVEGAALASARLFG